MSLQVDSIILCEDVREEVYNKFSLVGVYTSDIMVQSFPAQIKVAVFGAVRSDVAGTVAIGLRISLNDNLLLDETRDLAFTDDILVSNILVPQGTLMMSSELRLTVSISTEAGQWTEIVNRRIFKGSVTKR